MISEMTKASTKLRFSKRKGNPYLYGICASELVDWLVTKMEFKNRKEADGFLSIMVRYGYLISCELKDEFIDNSQIW
jgi:hypothetical protein